MVDDPRANPLEIEIRAEKAAAYFATARKMQDALRAIREFDRESRGGSGAGRPERREELLEEAAEKVCFFLVQREAMKLPMHEELLSEYEIPEEVRKRIGRGRARRPSG